MREKRLTPTPSQLMMICRTKRNASSLNEQK
jgi:hypothetical protein